MQKAAESPAVAALKPMIVKWMADCATFAWLQDMAADKFNRSQGIAYCLMSAQKPTLHDIGVV